MQVPLIAWQTICISISLSSHNLTTLIKISNECISDKDQIFEETGAVQYNTEFLIGLDMYIYNLI